MGQQIEPGIITLWLFLWTFLVSGSPLLQKELGKAILKLFLIKSISGTTISSSFISYSHRLSPFLPRKSDH